MTYDEQLNLLKTWRNLDNLLMELRFKFAWVQSRPGLLFDLGSAFIVDPVRKHDRGVTTPAQVIAAVAEIVAEDASQVQGYPLTLGASNLLTVKEFTKYVEALDEKVCAIVS